MALRARSGAHAARFPPTKVRVAYRRSDCVVVLPIGGRRVAVFVKARDVELFELPERRTLPGGVRVEYNARGREDGSIVLR